MRRSILDPSFRYRSSVDTDIRRTFKRARREMAKAEKPTPLTDPRLARVQRLESKAA